MKNEWKNLIIIGLSLALVANAAGNFILSFDSYPYWKYGGPPISRHLVVGIPTSPTELDPICSDEGISSDILYQILEGLYMHNLKDSNLEIVPRLAENFGNWDVSRRHFTIPLRQNVLFHDGTPFNATTVKWNFERITWFINGTGFLNQTLSPLHLIWKFPNGTFILDPINPVTINSEYNVTINLRAPFSEIEALLCHTSAYMLSPVSASKYEYIHPVYNQIVGTGAFVYDGYYYNSYFAEKEIKLHIWDNYWREPAFFEEVTFKVINDATTRNNAMLGHRIDYLIGPMSSLFPTFDTDPSIIHQSGIRGLEYNYLGMNNKKINKTWRQAISYGINYTYIIEKMQDGMVFRSNGPLSPNFPWYDSTIQAATYNLTKARELVVSMGFGDMSWTDEQWITTEFAVWNYTYPIGDDFREDLKILLEDNLNLIGIYVRDEKSSWAEFIYRAYGYRSSTYDDLELYWIGRSPDYLSPYNMITKYFSNISTTNAAQYHNHDVEMWLEQILKEINDAARQTLYSNTLHQIVEVDMPHAFGYHPYQHYVHSGDIHSVPYNALGRLYIYPMYRA